MDVITQDILTEYVIPYLLQKSYKSFLNLKTVSTSMKTIVKSDMFDNLLFDEKQLSDPLILPFPYRNLDQYVKLSRGNPFSSMWGRARQQQQQQQRQ